MDSLRTQIAFGSVVILLCVEPLVAVGVLGLWALVLAVAMVVAGIINS
jgi:hypothetical protein